MKCYEIDLSNLLKITMLDKSEFKPPQKHITRYTEEYILYVIEKGMLCIEHNGEKMELTEGDVCFFNKGEFQKPLKSTECNFYYLHFQTPSVCEQDMNDEEYCAAIRERMMNFAKADLLGTDKYDFTKVLIKRRFNIGDKNLLENIINILKRNALSQRHNTPQHRISVSGEIAQLLMRIENICFETADKSPQRNAYDTVKSISDYVHTHFRENFGSYEIERDLSFNYDYANRIFKKYMGYSIIKYRNKLRIDTAKPLLQEKTLDLIATEVGFSDRYYFSRCFKNFEGISPEKYRASSRKGMTND